MSEPVNPQKKLKILFPMDEEFSKFLHIASSKDGLIFPLKGMGKSNYHVTAIIHDKGTHLNINLHITDERTNKSVYSLTFQPTKEEIEKLFTEVKDVFIGAVLKLLKEAFPININKGVYLDISGADMENVLQAKNPVTAKEGWIEVYNRTPKDFKPITAETKLVYHKHKKKLLVKLHTDKYIYQDRLMEVMERAFESSSLKSFFGQIDDRIKAFFKAVEDLPQSEI